MKKFAALIALAIASLNVAQAQNQAPEADEMRYFVGMGFTNGGDTFATAHYTDGTDVNIRAGGAIAFMGGVDYRVNPHLVLQGSIGFHSDNASAENGSMRFTRYPIEMLAYFTPTEAWRIGGGLRYVTGAKFSSKGAAYVGNAKFDNTVGAVFEGEYLPSQHWGIKVRYVVEEYKEKGFNPKYKGDHVGVYGNYYF